MRLRWHKRINLVGNCLSHERIRRHKAATYINPELLWVNPDCGLKTRGWDETKKSLIKMIEAAQIIRKEYSK